MSATTKDKLEFTWAMARHTRATVRQCEALMRYAGTLQRLAELECNGPFCNCDEGQPFHSVGCPAHKRDRIKAKVTELCGDIAGYPDAFVVGTTGKVEDGEGPCVPIFSSDPRGAVLKIRVPSGYSNDMGREGICVPA